LEVRLSEGNEWKVADDMPNQYITSYSFFFLAIFNEWNDLLVKINLIQNCSKHLHRDIQLCLDENCSTASFLPQVDFRTLFVTLQLPVRTYKLGSVQNDIIVLTVYCFEECLSLLIVRMFEKLLFEVSQELFFYLVCKVEVVILEVKLDLLKLLFESCSSLIFNVVLGVGAKTHRCQRRSSVAGNLKLWYVGNLYKLLLWDMLLMVLMP
jgi:hypothetical protein